MGMLKLVIYGGLGYLAYQMFFADMPSRNRLAGGGDQGNSGTAENRGGQNAGRTMSGRSGEGMDVETQEPTGTSAHHRVGRGVIR